MRDPFTPDARFDFHGFAATVAVGVRMLDNVLDVTAWPLPQQRKEAMDKRRIGLGFTGLGDALIELDLRYDADEGRAMAAQIAEAMRDAAYLASVEIAKDKGSFPRLDAERTSSAPRFASRLPDEIKDAIRQHGIRNSHLLSIAPTGTISLAFADNASNGIEPAFSWFYTRRKRMPDDSMKEFRVEDHAYRVFKHQHGIDDDVELVDVRRGAANRAPGEASGPTPTASARAMLTPAFVSALEMSAQDHMRMSAAVQPFVDTAISKTVNVPADYPFDAFEDLYFEAWKAGLKGIATYRPNDVLGAVLEVASPAGAGDAAARTSIPPTRTAASASIARRSRRSPACAGRAAPSCPNGNRCWTYVVRHPLGDFAVFIGHIDDDSRYPFEVWINGAEQPRGLGAIAKTLSMDMRTDDRAWLDMKLSALQKAVGDDGFEMAMPPDGRKVRVPSLVSGFAKLIRYRCNELGAFAERRYRARRRSSTR